MSSLTNILSFIELKGIRLGTFERECGLPNATIGNKAKLKADLTSDIVDKISNRYKEELEKEGFYIVNIDPFGGTNWAILNKGEIEKYMSKEKKSAIDYEAKYHEQVERERKALEDDKAFFKEMLRTSLGAILSKTQEMWARQKGTADVVLESLERIEKRPAGDLLEEADRRTFEIDREASKPGNLAGTNS